jgi:hypothetical protein
VPDEAIPDANAIRFTYSWAGDGTFQLVDGVAVTMTALPGVTLQATDGPLTGFWYELRDEADVALWQLVARNPLLNEIETVDDEALTTVSGEPGAGVAVVVVPALPDGVAVAVMAPPAGEVDAASTELLVHPFEASP